MTINGRIELKQLESIKLTAKGVELKKKNNLNTKTTIMG